MYIFWFLHQTTTYQILYNDILCCISFDSYIKPQLYDNIFAAVDCCISFDSYIKPQRSLVGGLFSSVVYLLIPTSNHNNICGITKISSLYIFWFLHQTTTWWLDEFIESELYIFWFLHQTTTQMVHLPSRHRCISFDSYIKPQLCLDKEGNLMVVYLLIPTSNHNPLRLINCIVYVVYLLIPTSNHNYCKWEEVISKLYIFWFLHQTTTSWLHDNFLPVVYLLIPTSNHNMYGANTIEQKLYIFWFLHQTTTNYQYPKLIRSCISFDSYIKPQP